MKSILVILLSAGALVLLISYVCFRMTFYAPRKEKTNAEEYCIPKGKIYEPFRETMVNWIKELRAMPHEDMSIKSFDGLTLCGKYYEYAPGAVIELMFHGYKSNAERDLCGGVQRCFALGRSALIVDQRASGKSDGNIISFGVNESKDCHRWIEHTIKYFGPDVKIILTGISMGAATVLMAGGRELPPNVIGILADCGYSSAEAIIKKVIRDMKLPPRLLYPFIKLGARVFGHFDLEETPPIEAVRNCRVPVIFFHGEDDRFVPCSMSRENFEACASRKMLVITPGAGHGLCYPVDTEAYLKALREFFE